MVKIGIIGTGYVGLVTGTCLAEVGHDVICSDVNEEKIKMLKKGKCPIYEIGLQELIDKNVKNNRLKFTNDVSNTIKESEVLFSAVGTPMGENYEADLTYVREVAKSFAENLNSYKIFVNKSTVPVGTGDIVNDIILNNSKEGNFDVVSNPEFLREGAAIKDFLNPDRIIIGCNSLKAKKIMGEVYEPFQRSQSPILYTSIKSAELIKYASNSMLATRISFMNEIANFCEIVGANVKEVSKGMGFDTRIGPKFLQAGIGYGGSCFPKDVSALIESGREKGHSFSILKAVENVNEEQKLILVKKLKRKFSNLKDKNIAIWGLSFKPRTDDIREAPSIYIIRELLNQGAKIKVFDNIAEENFKKEYPEFKIKYCKDKYECLDNSDALLLLTEWDEFRILDYEKFNLMKNKLIFDGRNIYNPEEIRKNKIEYEGVGR
jgi:UDPglucose 6-dehydrogenase